MHTEFLEQHLTVAGKQVGITSFHIPTKELLVQPNEVTGMGDAAYPWLKAARGIPIGYGIWSVECGASGIWSLE